MTASREQLLLDLADRSRETLAAWDGSRSRYSYKLDNAFEELRQALAEVDEKKEDSP